MYDEYDARMNESISALSLPAPFLCTKIEVDIVSQHRDKIHAEQNTSKRDNKVLSLFIISIISLSYSCVPTTEGIRFYKSSINMAFYTSGDTVNAIVADFGSYASKVGYAGEDYPRSYFRSVSR
jgi:hypothetical protein